MFPLSLHLVLREHDKTVLLVVGLNRAPHSHSGAGSEIHWQRDGRLADSHAQAGELQFNGTTDSDVVHGTG